MWSITGVSFTQKDLDVLRDNGLLHCILYPSGNH